ncbi:MAG: hypothetical protein V4813_18735 [Gemmatimonadota bacterium]
MTFPRLTSLVLGTLVATATAQAQTERVAIDPHWRAFLGCWQSWGAGSMGPVVCLVPTESAERIEMVSLVNDSIVSRSPIITSGERTPVTRDGCTGWESGRWSADERRFFTRAEFTCDGGATQTASGIFAMTHSDAFSRIEGVKTKGATRVRAINFSWIDTVAVPSAIASRLPRFDAVPAVGARIEAAAALTIADVVEATKQVDGDVAEAWLAERGQQFDVAAKDLRALRDAGVPTSVIDMVVAVSHPRVFAIAPGNQGGARPAALDPRRTRSMNMTTRDAVMAEMRMMRLRSALSYGWGDFYDPYSGYYGRGYFSPFGSWGGINNWYGNNWYGNNWYGGGNGGGLYSNGPYVIVPQQPSSPSRTTGSVVNGSGYTQSGGSSSGIARPTPSVSSDGYSGGSSSGGGASSGGSAGGASGGGGGRTAKPRP